MTFNTAAPVPTSSIVVDAQVSPDISCHCLVVDESKMPADSTDRSHLTTALGLTKQALHQHVLTWLAFLSWLGVAAWLLDLGMEAALHPVDQSVTSCLRC
jgi:hypothetical protein